MLLVLAVSAVAGVGLTACGGAIPSPEYRYHCTLHPRRMHGTIEVTGWR
jgi:hypothetical protein